MSDSLSKMVPQRLAAIATAIGSILACTAGTAGGPPERANDKAPLRVEHDFAGGSGNVVLIDQVKRRIKIEPTAYEDRGWVCWWYFRVTGVKPGEVVTLEVGPAPWATPTRAAFSTDNQNWKQTKPGTANGKWMVYKQQIDAPSAWFAWGPPFVPRDSQELVHWAESADDTARVFQLCETRRGRGVPALRVEDRGSKPTFGVWVQARQHAWEAGSSWVCQGFVEWLVSDEARAESLRKLAAITVVPVMDIDNVARGAGGKNAAPHDHNRDWSDDPHWPAVRAAIKQLHELDSRQRLDLFVDLHNPGADATRPFFYITPRKLLSEWRQRNLDRFLAATRIEMIGPLAFVGETRESGAQYDANWQRISKNWVTQNTRPHVVAVTLETAWNTKHSHVSGYKTVGRQLGLAMERYLRLNPRAGLRKAKEPGQQ